MSNKSDDQLNEKELAKKYGIPKCLRQYAKRYGGLDVLGIVQMHRKHKGA